MTLTPAFLDELRARTSLSALIERDWERVSALSHSAASGQRPNHQTNALLQAQDERS